MGVTNNQVRRSLSSELHSPRRLPPLSKLTSWTRFFLSGTAFDTLLPFSRACLHASPLRLRQSRGFLRRRLQRRWQVRESASLLCSLLLSRKRRLRAIAKFTGPSFPDSSSPPPRPTSTSTPSPSLRLPPTQRSLPPQPLPPPPLFPSSRRSGRYIETR